MGWLSKLLGGPAVDAVTGVANIIDKFVETPDEKAAMEILKLKMAQRPGELQVELNKIEAGHRTVFVAGWRPFIGWVCGVGLAIIFILNPILQWTTGSPGPEINATLLLNLVVAMLGMSGLRSVEKSLGRAK